MPSNEDTTTLLQLAGQGDRSAVDRLFERVYDELRRVAHGQRRRAAPAETLTTTALVHEAYLRLVDARNASWNDRVHFFAIASRAMRFILVDAARARSAEKRGSGVRPADLDKVQVAADDGPLDVLVVHEALEHLAEYDQRLANVVQYRFFSGMNQDQIASALGVSVPTVKRDWVRAKAWLYRFINESDAAAPSEASQPGSNPA